MGLDPGQIRHLQQQAAMAQQLGGGGIGGAMQLGDDQIKMIEDKLAEERRAGALQYAVQIRANGSGGAVFSAADVIKDARDIESYLTGN